ncbi:MAG: type I-E CRISPR-associated protein Cse2/CasB [Alcaligenaceae bacterium]|nr:type I-E CRISPR-associated protein Cse2/CasB [Alcaligenaceae bacterium]
MSEHARVFVRHLRRLNGESDDEVAHGKEGRHRDAGAMAVLRRSLSFSPGAYPKAFPYVEPLIAEEEHDFGARRRAYYLVAGLYALNPIQCDQPFAEGLGRLAQKKIRQGGSAGGMELRLMALLGARPEGVAQYLRQLTTLLAADGRGCDHVALITDLCIWMNAHTDPDGLDRIRQRWARQFYQLAVLVNDLSADLVDVIDAESSLKG